MIRWIIGKVVGGLLAPLLKLGEKALESERDRARLAAGVMKARIAADDAVRRVKLGYLLGRLPLFVAEMSAALYFAAIMIDSTFPMEWLTPLELPRWFQPHFHWALASIFGLSIVARRWK